MESTLVKIEEVLGHFVKARLSVRTYMGKTTKEYEGRLVYSTHIGSLMFMPKGNRSKGYRLDAEDVHWAEIIRKDKAKHEQFLEIYKNRSELEQEERKRHEDLAKMRQESREERQKREAEAVKESQGLAIFQAQLLGGYDELEEEVLAYYRSIDGDNFKGKFVRVHFMPVIQNLHKKGIPNVDCYPKHYFDKSRNPKLCAMIEKKTGIKLGKTQNGNVKILNDYLQSK